MRLERRLTTGAVLVLLAGGATGGALAASGGTPAARPLPFNASRGGLLRASAAYLGVALPVLERELKGGKTLARVANATPGRSERALVGVLVADLSAHLQQVSDHPLSSMQQRALVPWLRRRVAGFLDDTCPLSLVGITRHLAGCGGMT